MESESKAKHLEDVAKSAPGQNLSLSLDEVGIERVQTQVLFNGALLPAKAMATVSLVDKESRGIHMSRMFKILNQLHETELSFPMLSAAVEQILGSHQGLSDAARAQVEFELPVRRKALLSAEQGWRNYPVRLGVAIVNRKTVLSLQTKVLYSSTCPCSASLTRQAIQEKFKSDFAKESITSEEVFHWLGKAASMVAVPHAQRSEAVCEFFFTPGQKIPPPLELIDEVEAALGTPVQTAVKREDEQEFGRRNASHLMFCEDAARKLKAALLKRDDLADFQIEVRHFESLHAHDVVAKVGKFD